MLTRALRYDRAKHLAAAATAERKGRVERAIAEYRRVLDQEGDDPRLLQRLARLQLACGRRPEAQQSLFAAAAEYRRQGFDDKALAVLRAGQTMLPQSVAVATQLADALVKRGHPKDAAKALWRTHDALDPKLHQTARLRLVRQILQWLPSDERARHALGYSKPAVPATRTADHYSSPSAVRRGASHALDPATGARGLGLAAAKGPAALPIPARLGRA